MPREIYHWPRLTYPQSHPSPNTRAPTVVQVKIATTLPSLGPWHHLQPGCALVGMPINSNPVLVPPKLVLVPLGAVRHAVKSAGLMVFGKSKERYGIEIHRGGPVES